MEWSGLRATVDGQNHPLRVEEALEMFRETAYQLVLDCGWTQQIPPFLLQVVHKDAVKREWICLFVFVYLPAPY